MSGTVIRPLSGAGESAGCVSLIRPCMGLPVLYRSREYSWSWKTVRRLNRHAPSCLTRSHSYFRRKPRCAPFWLISTSKPFPRPLAIDPGGDVCDHVPELHPGRLLRREPTDEVADRRMTLEVNHRALQGCVCREAVDDCLQLAVVERAAIAGEEVGDRDFVFRIGCHFERGEAISWGGRRSSRLLRRDAPSNDRSSYSIGKKSEWRILFSMWSERWPLPCVSSTSRISPA